MDDLPILSSDELVSLRKLAKSDPEIMTPKGWAVLREADAKDAPN